MTLTAAIGACLLTLVAPPCYPWSPLPSAQIKHWKPAGLQSLGKTPSQIKGQYPKLTFVF